MPAPLRIVVRREPYMDFFILEFGNQQSLELSPDETRAWFKERGANMNALENALDYCWNFHRIDLTIENPIEPKVRTVPGSTAPSIDPMIDGGVSFTP